MFVRRLLPTPRFALGLAIALAAGSAAAQIGTFATVSGRVVDLARDANGNILYCTDESEVGRITTSGVTILATAATGPFPNQLRGIAETPAGDVAVVDAVGDIYRLPGGAAPAVKVYTDAFMIQAPSDLVVDSAGNYLVASASPTSFVRAINQISPDGSKWGYYFVSQLLGQNPQALAFDPLTGFALFSDLSGSGSIRLIDTVDGSHPTSLVNGSAGFAFQLGAQDGDMAVESDGDILVISGGTVWKHDRASGVATQLATGFGPLRGIVITGSSGSVPSATGFSAYVAEGESPTAIREIGGVGAPAPVILSPTGDVPGPGTVLNAFFGMNVFDLAVDAGGNLLIGGDNFGVTPSVKRIELPSLAVTTLASDSQGITTRIEGVATAADGTIRALDRDGRVYRIQESPFLVSVDFDDPLDQIAGAQDLVLDRDGSFFIGAVPSFANGALFRAQPFAGSATQVATTIETRGVATDPLTGGLLITKWNNSGFQGAVDRWKQAGGLAPIPGFAGMNYSNGGVWGDGDCVADAAGNVYTCSEDDFSVYRFERSTGKLFRIASGYLARPSGLAITRSTLPSTTGWSLYVSEFTFLHEIPNVPPPLPAISDVSSPPVGRVVGWFPPDAGTARDLVVDPAGGALLVSTSFGRIERITTAGVSSTLAGLTQGVTGDLTGLASDAAGFVYAARRDGVLFRLDPNAGYAANVVFSDATDVVKDVHGLSIDGSGRLLIVDRPDSMLGGRLWRFDGANVTTITRTARGVRAAVDPLTAEIWVTEQGNPLDGGGEILRVDPFANPPTAGHFRWDVFGVLSIGANDGGIAMDSNGNAYVATGDVGRVFRVDRATGTRTIVAGGYAHPIAVALAPGTPGTAGPQGTSL
ncbi:MAG TPA: hypothetical protein VKE69_04105, partial [Planctomycetota bacterium]|nr:hypothetical protein [Planctomycetota bacterium]